MRSTTAIRRRPGGSIDTKHYARLGRELHGKAVRDAVVSAFRAIARLATSICLPAQARPVAPSPELVRTANRGCVDVWNRALPL